MITATKVKTRSRPKSTAVPPKPNELVTKRPSWAEAKPGPAVIEGATRAMDEDVEVTAEASDIKKKFIKAAKRFVVETSPNPRVRKHSRAFKRDQYTDMDQRLSMLMDKRLSIGGGTLTSEQVQEYEEAFDSFDVNGDGDLSIAELSDLLKKIGVKHTDSELKNVIESGDTDNDGKLDRAEFVKLMGRLHNPTNNILFRLFDTTGNGCITLDDFKDTLLTLDDSFTDPEINRLVEQIDGNNDGVIEISEFLSAINVR